MANWVTPCVSVAMSASVAVVLSEFCVLKNMCSRDVRHCVDMRGGSRGGKWVEWGTGSFAYSLSPMPGSDPPSEPFLSHIVLTEWTWLKL